MTETMVIGLSVFNLVCLFANMAIIYLKLKGKF
ncbi:hypothetical protein HLBENOHH_02453 [Aeromonas dhakensis]